MKHLHEGAERIAYTIRGHSTNQALLAFQAVKHVHWFPTNFGPLTVRLTLALPESYARMSPVMAKKFLCLVVNGKVANNEALRAAVAQQRGFGHRVEVHVTWEGG